LRSNQSMKPTVGRCDASLPLYENTSIANHARPRRRWLILFSLDVIPPREIWCLPRCSPRSEPFCTDVRWLSGGDSRSYWSIPRRLHRACQLCRLRRVVWSDIRHSHSTTRYKRFSAWSFCSKPPSWWKSGFHICELAARHI